MYGNEDSGYGPERKFAPVKEGDELDVKIEAVGDKGDGVAKVEGFVLFIPGTKAGETVKVKITKVLKKVGFAEKIGSAEKSNGSDQERVMPSAESKREEESQEPIEDTEDFGEDLE